MEDPQQHKLLLFTLGLLLERLRRKAVCSFLAGEVAVCRLPSTFHSALGLFTGNRPSGTMTKQTLPSPKLPWKGPGKKRWLGGLSQAHLREKAFTCFYLCEYTWHRLWLIIIPLPIVPFFLPFQTSFLVLVSPDYTLV